MRPITCENVNLAGIVVGGGGEGGDDGTSFGRVRMSLSIYMKDGAKQLKGDGLEVFVTGYYQGVEGGEEEGDEDEEGFEVGEVLEDEDGELYKVTEGGNLIPFELQEEEDESEEERRALEEEEGEGDESGESEQSEEESSSEDDDKEEDEDEDKMKEKKKEKEAVKLGSSGGFDFLKKNSTSHNDDKVGNGKKRSLSWEGGLEVKGKKIKEGTDNMTKKGETDNMTKKGETDKRTKNQKKNQKKKEKARLRKQGLTR
jgi:hypothetical protein